MMTHPRQFVAFFSALMLVVIGVLWIAFAPTQFGGSASYILINGNSMEPNFHRGDLVILRESRAYNIGDVATYRHPDIGFVIHRIVERDGEQFVLQGDNNDWIDSYQPGQDEFVGKLWLHLPKLGTYIERLRTPWALAIIAALMGGLAVSTIPTGNEQRRRNRPSRRESAQSHQIVGQQAVRESALLILALVAVASLALGLFTWTRPLTRTAEEKLDYQHTAHFSYSAAVPPGVYDSPAARTGDPIFRQLTDTVDVQFDYHLTSALPTAVQGTYRLIAEISDTSGWTRNVELGVPRSFTGGAFTAKGTLDLARIQEQIDRFEQHTGVQRQQYIIAIAPQVQIEGTIAGESMEEQFIPQLAFTLDRLQLQVAKEASRVGDVYQVLQPGTITRPYEEPNTISLLRLKMEIATARWIALIVLATSLAGIAGMAILSTAATDEASRIRSRYGSLLVDVRTTSNDRSETALEVSSIDDLARLAEKTGGMILHVARGMDHTYLIRSDGATYRYTIGSQPLQHQSQQEQRPQRWQTAFLHALREKGAVPEACRVANVGIVTVYRQREHDAAFARAWDEARGHN
jgi:signal peptidase I